MGKAIAEKSGMACFSKKYGQSDQKKLLADCLFLWRCVYMAEIRFASKEHREFYLAMLQKCGNSDSFHRAFFYCVGISDTTRKNVSRIFDFENDRMKTDGLHEGWQTGGTMRLTRLAFNLWNGYTEQGAERMSAPYEMFACDYAPYFLEAVKLRYPEYCREITAGKEMEGGR